MSPSSLDARKMKALQPAHELWHAYRPEKAEFAFRATSNNAARTWQTKTRKALRDAIGFQSGKRCDPKPRILERVDKGDFIREKLLLRTSPHTVMPVYMLLPKQITKPRPTVLALHGHGYGVKDVVGLWEDGSERNQPETYHWDFAVALCRRGFVVAAPEISCFGERQTDFSYLNVDLPWTEEPRTCEHTAALASHLGGSVLGIRVRDGRRLVDYLASRKEVNVRKLGAMGLSGGGTHTFFSTCVDTRIKACVVSGYFSAWRDSIHAMHHCACNYVHGLGRFGEIYDLAGLIAPRPILIESATRDDIFPVRSVKRSIARTRDYYDVFGARGNVQADIFEGRHEISGRKAYDFLTEHLGL
jgi:dienelactone hydrolase